MFSGIIVTTGRIVAIEPTPAGVRVRIDPGNWGHTPEPGGSVCVSGCCLTQVGEVGADGVLSFDAIPETLAKTILGGLGPGDRVNLEPSVLASTPMDGHVVQGHIEGLGEVVKVVTEAEYRVRIAPPPELMPCLVPKGSVTVDGVSLTIAAVCTGTPQTGAGAFQPPVLGDITGDRALSRAGKPAPLSVDPAQWFEVALIPTTLELTTMGDLQVGSKVNLETDILARTVVHVMQHYAGLMGRG